MMNEVEIKKIINQLPTAHKVYARDGVEWKIYLAKDFFVPNWKDEAVRKVVLECRKSFRRYGEIHLEDEFDIKSLVLLIQVNFDIDGTPQQEFFSLRLVPASGEPFLTEDLKITFLDGKNLYEIMRERLSFGQSQVEENIFTISRFCGFSLVGRSNTDIYQSQKLRFTTISLVLMWLFALNNLSKMAESTYLTAMFNQDIFNKLSRCKFNNRESDLFLPEISETMAGSSDFFKIFSPGPVAFHYPTYFFHLPQLVSWLKKIMIEKKITIDTIKHFLQMEIDWVQLEEYLLSNKIAVIKKLSGLGKMLNSTEALPGSDLDSAQLRADLAKSATHPLVLKLIKLKDLEDRLKKFLNDLNFFF